MIDELQTVSAKLGQSTDKLTKKIGKGAKKLAKKIAREVKPKKATPVAAKLETTKPVAKAKPVTDSKPPKIKKKNDAAQ